jgi:hypothetical protein
MLLNKYPKLGLLHVKHLLNWMKTQNKYLYDYKQEVLGRTNCLHRKQHTLPTCCVCICCCLSLRGDMHINTVTNRRWEIYKVAIEMGSVLWCTHSHAHTQLYSFSSSWELGGILRHTGTHTSRWHYEATLVCLLVCFKSVK